MLQGVFQELVEDMFEESLRRTHVRMGCWFALGLSCGISRQLRSDSSVME
jgi:hypothetical protein